MPVPGHSTLREKVISPCRAEYLELTGIYLVPIPGILRQLSGKPDV